MGKQFYFIQQAKRSADVYIFGDIVVYECCDGDVSACGLVAQIRGLDVDEINVYIDSYGGAVSEGWAIYQALRQHPANVNTYGMGFVASAAIFPFLAGKKRCAMSTSAYYLHQVMMEVYGNADVLRAAANEAEMMTDVGIAAFTENTPLDAATVKQMMQQEVWLNPTQVLELGIATEIQAEKMPPYLQDAKKQIFARFLSQTAQQNDIPAAEAKATQAAQDTLCPAQPEQSEQDTPSQAPAPSPPSIMQMLAGIFID